jgi:ATP-dependent Clp protease ATP-binding subunit ClpA
LNIKDLNDRLVERNITVELRKKAKECLAQEGYEPAFGARPLKRFIQRTVETPIAYKLIKGEINNGQTVIIDMNGDKISISTK